MGINSGNRSGINGHVMINSIKETYKDFYLFLKRPIDKADPIQSKQHITKRLLALLVINVPITVFFGILIYYIERFELISTDRHKVKLLFQQVPLWHFILMVVVVVPFIEELVFRLYLRLKDNNLTHFVTLLAAVTGKENKYRMKTYLDSTWSNNFHGLFYFSAIMFAVFHLSNYESSNALFYLSPILIAPQFIAGLFLGYLRIKYNLFVGYFMHAFHNGLLILISIFIIK